MAFNISKRKYIKWEDDDAFEDTETIVLTYKNGYYVDIRLKIDHQFLTPEKKLQWAFAGSSESSTNEDGSRHTTWHHHIDSQSTNPESDSGDMQTLPDGDTLEKGVMAHPETGVLRPYRELWTDLPSDGPYALLSLDKTDEDMRGMVIRIGGRIQGVLRKGDMFDYQVWQHVSGREWNLTATRHELGILYEAASQLFDLSTIPAVGSLIKVHDGVEWLVMDKTSSEE